LQVIFFKNIEALRLDSNLLKSNAANSNSQTFLLTKVFSGETLPKKQAKQNVINKHDH